VQKRRERKNAFGNRLAAAIGFNSWDAGDSDDEDEEGYFAQYSNQVYELGSSAITNAWSTVGSWLGLGGAATTIHESDEEKDKTEDTTTNDKAKRISTAVQYSNDLPPLLAGEIEDEVWENQRWTPATGWTAKTLGKTERCAFTDHLGRGSFQKPSDIEGGPAIPADWEVLGAWQIDMSGVNKGRCDKEGYCYSLDWPLLDADLARGRFNVAQGARDFVRRRRWYRRRACSKASNLLDTTSPILSIGWMGSRSPGTGRWHSRLFVLTRPGLQIGSTVTKAPPSPSFDFPSRSLNRSSRTEASTAQSGELSPISSAPRLNWIRDCAASMRPSLTQNILDTLPWFWTPSSKSDERLMRMIRPVERPGATPSGPLFLKRPRPNVPRQCDWLEVHLKPLPIPRL
jgi:hypothetical protein